MSGSADNSLENQVEDEGNIGVDSSGDDVEQSSSSVKEALESTSSNLNVVQNLESSEVIVNPSVDDNYTSSVTNEPTIDPLKGSKLIDRSKFEEEFGILKAERNSLFKLSIQLQNQIAQFVSKKGDDPKSHGPDQEVRYIRQLWYLSEQISEEEAEQAQHERLVETVGEKISELENETKSSMEAYFKMLRDVTMKARDVKTGAMLSREFVESYTTRLRQKLNELHNIRIKHIQITNTVQDMESQFKGQDGHEKKRDMLDFEHLKIENQTFTDKLEERNEEILKLRLKISSTVQILSHVKEKIHYYSSEHEKKKHQNKKLDDEITKMREELGKYKKSREHYRKLNKALTKELGLMNHIQLLEDYDKNMNESETLEAEIQNLKQQQLQAQHTMEVKEKELIKRLKFVGIEM